MHQIADTDNDTSVDTDRDILVTEITFHFEEILTVTFSAEAGHAEKYPADTGGSCEECSGGHLRS